MNFSATPLRLCADDDDVVISTLTWSDDSTTESFKESDSGMPPLRLVAITQSKDCRIKYFHPAIC
jgi:hypothetical protein